MSYILIRISIISWLAAMAMLHKVMQNSDRHKSVTLPFCVLTFLITLSTSTASSGVFMMLENEQSQETQEAKTFSVQSDSLKSLPRYIDVLRGKAREEFGESLVSIFQEETRYVLVKKTDFTKFRESKGLNQLAKSDCDQVLEISGSRRIDIRYIDVGSAVIKDVDCDLIATRERASYTRVKQ